MPSRMVGEEKHRSGSVHVAKDSSKLTISDGVNEMTYIPAKMFGTSSPGVGNVVEVDEPVVVPIIEVALPA